MQLTIRNEPLADIIINGERQDSILSILWQHYFLKHGSADIANKYMVEYAKQLSITIVEVSPKGVEK